ncbi:MAG: type II toxin-antitoxin system death-on-curing family toxin [Acholeplasmatales bacterium]|nr:type II toxin-antitoxin system death-on-curing family toxin [Acholeplasmatales bacterium]
MIKFNKETILKLYEMMTDATGGTIGIRDEGMLLSALEAPFQTFANTDLYPNILNKAARLGYGLVANHPFVDGNKRIGVFAMLVFLDLNGIHLEFTDNEIIILALNIADGSYKYEDILRILESK